MKEELRKKKKLDKIEKRKRNDIAVTKETKR